MQEIKHRVEAILFTTGRFLSVEEIANLSSLSNEQVIEAMKLLIEDYSKRDTSLEIIQSGEKYKLNIKKEHIHLTTSLLKNTELDKPTQETLALIAYKQPVTQSLIVKIRGNTAYEHIKSLEKLDFVTSEKSGRTRLLKITQKFYEYFDIVEDELKQKLNQINQNED